METEREPKPIETLKTSAPESRKKESIVLNFDAIKNVIIAQIGNKAEIDRLEIEEVAEGVKLTAEIDAGVLGGKILIEGFIVNTPNEIAIQDLKIDARRYVKSRIESSLSVFAPTIKKYFEKQYGKLVSRIQIVNSNLVVNLDNTLKENAPQDNKSKTQIEHLLEAIDKTDPWMRTNVIKDYCKDFIEQGRYDDARSVAGLLKGEKGRNETIANIDRIENSRGPNPNSSN